MAVPKTSFRFFLNNFNNYRPFIFKRHIKIDARSFNKDNKIKKLCVGLAAGSATGLIFLWSRWKLTAPRSTQHQEYEHYKEGSDTDVSSVSLYDLFKMPTAHALKSVPRRPTEDHVLKGLKLNHRERRFMKFASVEHRGQLYMTPQDFIESVTDSEPRPRLKRRILYENELESFASETPLLSKGSPHMFRTIYDKGVISYTEYLFLLSILTKPQTGFRIAFNMFDTDGNQRVDKNEFQVLLHLLTLAALKDFKKWVSKAAKNLPSGNTEGVEATLEVLEKIFSTARKDRLSRAMEGVAKTAAPNKDGAEVVPVEDQLQKRHSVDTTLLVHFFGKKGKQELKYEEFKMFMENLQTEVLEIEFNEFSKGLPTISELDFAKILLRYTYLGSDQYEMYLERLLDRIPEEIGITFAEFKSFCQFLNTLDDFSIAMKMYTLADQPISQDEFHRAVKICTGQELSVHIVDTVFKIFDDDGDGQLSYKEFIAIMRNRLHRGFKDKHEPYWDRFKQCLSDNYYATRK